MTKNKHGFTIVEVTIVIVIIAILASITIIAYAKVQIDSRDTQRSSEVSLIAGALEKYYQQNGEYPSCTAMTQSGSQVSTTLSGLDFNVLVAPKSAAGTTNSITCTALVSGSGTDAFAYVGDGSTACASGSACLEYVLQYRQESTGNIISLSSRHQTQVATSGTPVLTAVTGNSTQINLSWTAVNNAISYKVQQAADSAFTSGVIETSSNGLSTTASSLAQGTQYYFRVAAVAQSSQGAWSNTANATTTVDPPTTPTMSAILSGTNAQGTVNNVTCTGGATAQYQLRSRNTATGTMGAWSSWTAWSTTQVLTVAALQGYQYGFQAQAQCVVGAIASTTSALSNIPTIVRPIVAPAAPTYLAPAAFNSNVLAAVTYTTTCPAGTSVVSGTFRSLDWLGGNWGPYAFGTNDSWQNTSGVDKNVQYWGKYKCQTTYSTSPISPESASHTTVVHTQ